MPLNMCQEGKSLDFADSSESDSLIPLLSPLFVQGICHLHIGFRDRNNDEPETELAIL